MPPTEFRCSNITISENVFSASRYLMRISFAYYESEGPRDYFAVARPEGPAPIIAMRLIAPGMICDFEIRTLLMPGTRPPSLISYVWDLNGIGIMSNYVVSRILL